MPVRSAADLETITAALLRAVAFADSGRHQIAGALALVAALTADPDFPDG